MSEIDNKIQSSLKKWKLGTISKVDLAVLRVSVSEIFYYEEIPDSVAINEAVDIAKKFGGVESGKFVNGVLGKIVKTKTI